MANLPKLPNQFYAERKAVLKIADLVNQQGHIFRETPHTDVGLDGQIEYVNVENEPTGGLLAVQIKYGDSYLTDRNDHWIFYPKKKHVQYWINYPIPVILFIYSPTSKCTYFARIQEELNSNPQQKGVKIFKDNIFELASRETIFDVHAKEPKTSQNIEGLLAEMVNRKCQNPTFNISFFDLFVQGLTNLCRHLFFSMSLAIDIAEFNNESEYGLGMGYNEYEFLHEYAKFLLSRNLAQIDYNDYLIDWQDNEMVPVFHVPLTARGNALINMIKKKEQDMDLPAHVNLISEMTLRREYLPSDYQRLQKAKLFQKKWQS